MKMTSALFLISVSDDWLLRGVVGRLCTGGYTGRSGYTGCTGGAGCIGATNLVDLDALQCTGGASGHYRLQYGSPIARSCEDDDDDDED